MVIKKAEYVTSCVDKRNYPNVNLPEFIFLGRSNVGKSSFINALTNRKNLAYTSSKPGKTLTLNFYNINDTLYFVDVPGYGYASKTIGQRLDFGKMIEEYLTSQALLKKCFLLVDARHKPTDDDVLMYNYLLHYDIDVVIIATKCDKIPKMQLNKHLKVIFETLNINDSKICVPFSSTTKMGVEKVWQLIDESI